MTTQKTVPVLLDFETRSRADLKVVGGRKYAYDPTTQIINLGYSIGLDGPEKTWWPIDGEPMPADLRAAVAGGSPLVAHNAYNFDMHVWNAQGYPAAAKWIDSLWLGLRVGLPAGLDKAGERLCGIRKDKAGSRLILKLCKPDKRTGDFPPISHTVRKQLQTYVEQDVRVLKAVYREALRVPEPDMEPAIRDLTLTMNERGVPVDLALVDLLDKLSTPENLEIVQLAQEATGLDLVGLRASHVGNPFFKWLLSRGVKPPDLRKETLTRIAVRRSPGDPVRVAIEGRVAGMNKAASRMSKLKARVDNGKLRGSSRYHGGHTARWSGAGAGVNLQNLQRGSMKGSDAAAAADEALRIGKLPEGADVASLVRTCFTASPGNVLACADYSMIEPRVAAWLAGEDDVLAGFTAGGPDYYMRTAAPVFQKPAEECVGDLRQAGKVIGLGAQFGQSGGGLEYWAKSTYGLDLRQAGVDPDKAVARFRESRPLLVALWNRLVSCSVDACLNPGRIVKINDRLAVTADGQHMYLRYPSGRIHVYRDAKVIRDRYDRRVVQFIHPQKGSSTLWRGAMIENAVQAVARDILADAMLRVEAAGIELILTVHDEIVADTKAGRLDEMIAIMEVPPAWAPDIPLAVEGWEGFRYRK